eukprot:605081-Prorocentrum_minimum.AAC.1
MFPKCYLNVETHHLRKQVEVPGWYTKKLHIGGGAASVGRMPVSSANGEEGSMAAMVASVWFTLNSSHSRRHAAVLATCLPVNVIGEVRVLMLHGGGGHAVIGENEHA